MPVNSGVLRFAKISHNAIIPTMGSTLAAGYDLYRFFAICCCVLMFPSVAGVKSTVEICVNIGQKQAQLFSIDNDYADPSLYHEPQKHLASWEGTTFRIAYMNPDYDGKIFMDRNRNIWIFDVETKDAGNYYLKFGIQSERSEITLNVTEKNQECPNDHPDIPKEAPDNPGSNMYFLLFLIPIILGLFICVLCRKKILSCITMCRDTNTSNPSSSGNAGTPMLQDTDTSNPSSSGNAGETGSKHQKQPKKDKMDKPRDDETFRNGAPNEAVEEVVDDFELTVLHGSGYTHPS